MQSFTIDPAVFDELIAYGEATPRVEVCGALLGQKSEDGNWLCDEFIPLTNVSPHHHGAHYIPSPDELFQALNKTRHMNKKAEKDLVGIYHTHPMFEPYPSSTDILGAGYEGAYVIYSPMKKQITAHYYDGHPIVFDQVPMRTHGVEGNVLTTGAPEVEEDEMLYSDEERHRPDGEELDSDEVEFDSNVDVDGDVPTFNELEGDFDSWLERYS